MVLFITFITILHSLLFFYDESLLNKKRELTKFENISVYIDGFFFLVPVAMTLFTNYDSKFNMIYLIMSIFSCLSIIKNELFYTDLSKRERLVHAALYVLHPLILYAFHESWKQDFFKNNMTYWMLQLGYFILCVKAITYHVIYWNYIHKK